MKGLYKLGRPALSTASNRRQENNGNNTNLIPLSPTHDTHAAQECSFSDRLQELDWIFFFCYHIMLS